MRRKIGAMTAKDRSVGLQNGTEFNATSKNFVAVRSCRRFGSA
jgi:hypothetical protein